MPPSTATQRRDVLLDALDRVQRHAGVRAPARGPARSAGACRGPSSARARPRRAPRRTPRSTAARLLLGVGARRGRRRGPRPANSPSAGERGDRARGTARARAAASRCGRAGRAASSPSTPATRSIALGRLGHREAELRVRLAGRDLLVRVAAHVRGDAHEHRLRRRAARGARADQRARAARSRRRLSITISPTPRSQRQRELRASDLALPCSTIRSGAKPARERQVQLAAGGDVAPQALLRRTARSTARAGERLGGEHDLEVRRGRVARPAARKARARARRSSSATT